jgi:hypothetical protein
MLVYRIILLLALIGGIWFYISAKKKRPDLFSDLGDWIQSQWNHTIATLKDWHNLSLEDSFSITRQFVFVLALLSFLVLALTGFIPVIITGHHLGGFLLVVHVIAAPIFILSIGVLAVLAAHYFRFDKEDWTSIKSAMSNEDSSKEKLRLFWRKLLYWIILLLSLPVAMSIVLSMYPIFGTDGQEILLTIHRYSTLLIAFAVLAYSYLVTLQTRQKA